MATLMARVEQSVIFEIRFLYYTALAILELALQTKLFLNSHSDTSKWKV